VGWTLNRAELGNPKSSLKTAREDSGHVRVTVDEAGEQRLSPAVVDVGVPIRSENRVGGADRHDSVALDRQRHIVLNGIDGDDRGVSEDHSPAWRRLRPQAAVFEKDGGGTRSGSGQQVAAADVQGAIDRRSRHDVSLPHAAAVSWPRRSIIATCLGARNSHIEIERFARPGQQRLAGERLREHTRTPPSGRRAVVEAGCITGHQENPRAGPLAGHPFSQLGSVHPRKHDVGEQQVDLGMFHEHLERALPRSPLQ